MPERWKPVPGYEEHYEVSDFGNCRRISKAQNTHVGRQLKAHLARHGYRRFALSVSRLYSGVKHWNAHRLVWEAFNGPIPDGLEINHRNGVKDDNRLENLEVVTASQNKLHSIYVLGKYPTSNKPKSKGSLNGRAIIAESDVPKIRAMISLGQSDFDIALVYGVSPATIWHIRKGKTWKHVAM